MALGPRPGNLHNKTPGTGVGGYRYGSSLWVGTHSLGIQVTQSAFPLSWKHLGDLAAGWT